MKRILINATHNEEIRVALCKDNHLYDFDLENRTREQKKANIYKGHVTRVEPSLEAVFVEYGSARQGFLPLREIAPEYFRGNPKEDSIKQLIREGDELIVQVEKEERGNKGAALSTYVSLAGRYLVLMPNNAKGGGISRQISGKVREEMRQIIGSLTVPKNMSIIVRTAGIGRGFDDLQNDLNHLLETWSAILEQNKNRPSPCLVHQEAGVVTRAVRDHLRDDISEVWIDSENAYNEAASFIAAVMPAQMNKLRKYTEYEPLFTRFGVERQIETAYQREVRLPSGGSIVIDQTEALVSIDINSAKSTKGSDVSETAYHTNLEAAEEIARQLRLRDMGGLIVIDFIDMNETQHQKDVEKRLIDSTRYDRARVQFAEISRFGLMEMSRQRLRPSLEEATGYLCPRCHGNGMIRDLRSLSLSIMRQIEQIALKERMGEIQAEVPTEIAAFLLNEKRESLVYLEQDSGTRVTILPHAHLESPNFSLHFNPDGFAPASYERIVDSEEQLNIDRGYDTNWHTEEAPKPAKHNQANHWQDNASQNKNQPKQQNNGNGSGNHQKSTQTAQAEPAKQAPQAVAWLSNLFAPKPSASVVGSLTNHDAAAAIEAIVNGGGTSLGVAGNVSVPTAELAAKPIVDKSDTRKQESKQDSKQESRPTRYKDNYKDRRRNQDDNKSAKAANTKPVSSDKPVSNNNDKQDKERYQKREQGSRRDPRGEVVRGETLTPKQAPAQNLEQTAGEHKTDKTSKAVDKVAQKPSDKKAKGEFDITVSQITATDKAAKTVHLSIDGSKPMPTSAADTSTAGTADVLTAKTKEAQEETTKVETAAVVGSSTDTAALVATTPAEVQSTEVQQTETKPIDEPALVAKATAISDKPSASTMRPSLPRRASANLNNMIDGELASRVAASMGLVKNDPRVIKAALSKDTDTAPATKAITGKAGEFIRTHVADADIRLAKGEFIACFIEAVSKVNAPANVRTAADFDFVNYGYDVLKADYLNAFHTLTTSVAQFDAPQGKAIVSPSPIGKRANNDPRGQHPDYLAVLGSASVDTKQTADDVAPTAADNLLDVGDTAHQAARQAAYQASEEPSANTDEMVSSIDGMEGVMQQLADTLSELLEGANNAASTDDTADEVADDIDESSDRESKKTTISSYKNMIESVADQLLPQTGILNLAVSKPSKAAKPAPKPKGVPSKKARTAGTNKPKAEVVRKRSTDDTDSTTGDSDIIAQKARSE